jgi:hypothetical protein
MLVSLSLESHPRFLDCYESTGTILQFRVYLRLILREQSKGIGKSTTKDVRQKKGRES